MRARCRGFKAEVGGGNQASDWPVASAVASSVASSETLQKCFQGIKRSSGPGLDGDGFERKVERGSTSSSGRRQDNIPQEL